MYRNFARALVLIPAGILVSLQSQAQNISRSFENMPYSRYGIGEEINGNNVTLRGMANASSAYSNPYAVNTDNPASYASIKYTTYEGGGEGRTRTIIASGTAGESTYKTGSATLSYINLGIPLGKNGGMAIGFRPMSRVSYALSDTFAAPQIGQAVNYYSGDGGINYFFVGGAGTYKGFSLGANVGYLFGTIRHTSNLKNIDTTYAYDSDFSKYTRVGSLYFKLGAQYEKALNERYSIRFGATASLQQKVNVTYDEYWMSYPSFSTDTSGYDTAYSVTDLKGKITMPLSYSIGVQLINNNSWSLGVDYRNTSWNQYSNNGAKDSLNKNAYRIALGGEFTPNASSIYNYWQRVTYRLGFYYGRDYVKVQNTDLNYYAVTVGLSLPFKRSADRIHAAMEIGRLGTKSEGVLQQNFMRFSLGITLNDRWFIPRKYD